MKQFLDLLSPLSAVNFNLCLKDIDFDALPTDLKAYTLVEMEEWDESSRETTGMEEKRSSSDLIKVGFEAELDKLRSEFEQLKEVKDEVKIIKEKLQDTETENQEQRENNEKLQKQINEQNLLIQGKEEVLSRAEARFTRAEEAWNTERKKLDEVCRPDHYSGRTLSFGSPLPLQLCSRSCAC